MMHLPIDFIGFVFAKSKREVTPEQAAKLIALYRKEAVGTIQAKMVGVFVNPTLEQLADVLAIVDLDVIQLHGQESPEFCKAVRDRFGKQVFKAFPSPIAGESNPPAQLFGPYLDGIDGALLDTVLPNVEGGTGMTFDWTVLPEYIGYAKKNELPLFIAGGLNPDNVNALLIDYAPFGVDVSSGVESDGVKDSSKIARFVERVKQL
jgi:phosphoribosylanthranilate isomerase